MGGSVKIEALEPTTVKHLLLRKCQAIFYPTFLCCFLGVKFIKSRLPRCFLIDVYFCANSLCSAASEGAHGAQRFSGGLRPVLGCTEKERKGNEANRKAGTEKELKKKDGD